MLKEYYWLVCVYETDEERDLVIAHMQNDQNIVEIRQNATDKKVSCRFTDQYGELISTSVG